MDLLTNSDRVMLKSSQGIGGDEFVNDISPLKIRGFITPCSRCKELAHHTFNLNAGTYSCDNCGYPTSSVSVSIKMQKYADARKKAVLAAYNKLSFVEKVIVNLRGGLFNCIRHGEQKRDS